MAKSRLQVLKIQTEGLRCVDCDLDFRHNENLNDTKKINIVIMPNGAGKTTIRDLITMCLSKSYKGLNSDEVYGFRRKSIGNEENAKYEYGFFKLAIEFEGIRYDYELNFDFT